MIIEAGRNIGQLWSKFGLFLKLSTVAQQSRQGKKVGVFCLVGVFFKLTLLQGICPRPFTQTASLIMERKVCNSENTSVSLETLFSSLP